MSTTTDLSLFSRGYFCDLFLNPYVIRPPLECSFFVLTELCCFREYCGLFSLTRVEIFCDTQDAEQHFKQILNVELRKVRITRNRLN